MRSSGGTTGVCDRVAAGRLRGYESRKGCMQYSSGCTIEAHNFQRDLAQYEKMNAVILGVSVGTVDSHKQFCTREGLSFKLLADSEQKLVHEYGSVQSFNGNTVAARNTFIINPKGKIVKEYIKVDPTKHSEELLAALATL